MFNSLARDCARARCPDAIGPASATAPAPNKRMTSLREKSVIFDTPVAWADATSRSAMASASPRRLTELKHSMLNFANPLRAATGPPMERAARVGPNGPSDPGGRDSGRGRPDAGSRGRSTGRPSNQRPDGVTRPSGRPPPAPSLARTVQPAGFGRRRSRPRSPPAGRPRFCGHRGARTRLGGDPVQAAPLSPSGIRLRATTRPKRCFGSSGRASRIGGPLRADERASRQGTMSSHPEGPLVSNGDPAEQGSSTPNAGATMARRRQRVLPAMRRSGRQTDAAGLDTADPEVVTCPKSRYRLPEAFEPSFPIRDRNSGPGVFSGGGWEN